MRARFLEDVVRVYRNPVVGIDIVDIEVVFRGVRSPTLGVGTASGEWRARRAAAQAIHEAGSRAASHALMVFAFAPGELRLSDSKFARNLINSQLDTDTFIVSGLIESEQLAPGSMRVSVLLG